MFSNPCSLDLHIDDKCYYKTRFKKIDLTSLNIVDSQASDFWKKIYFKNVVQSMYCENAELLI